MEAVTVAEQVLSGNWVWSLESVVGEIPESKGHASPIVAQPSILLKHTWHIAKPQRYELTRPDVELSMFENIHDFNVDAILFDMFEHCDELDYAVRNLEEAVQAANRHFRNAYSSSLTKNIVVPQYWFDDTNEYSCKIHTSPYCATNTVYALTHKHDVGALYRNGIKFGMGIWHPSMCVKIKIEPRHAGLLDVMTSLGPFG